ncbi:MAG: hypothetical protein EHM20_01010, partial [Alphaproteobacteria bacterium]
MPIRKFPFTVTNRPKPMLGVRLTNLKNGKSISTWALIDTGADATSFPEWFARSLNLDLKKDYKKINTGNGETKASLGICKIEVYDSKVPEPNSIQKAVAKGNVIYKKENASIDFLPELETALLGVDNFLGEFVLKINY